MTDFVERYKALNSSSARLSLLNSVSNAPIGTIGIDERLGLVRLILDDLRNGYKIKGDALLSTLVALKTLGRNAQASQIISEKENLRTLHTIAIPTGEAPKEALRCIANALLLVESGRHEWIALGGGETATQILEREASPDYIFLAARILFLSTVHKSGFVIRAIDQLGTPNTIALKLGALLSDLQHSLPMSKEAMIDLLKYTFNLLLQYPRMKQEANPSPKGKEVPGKFVMGDLWDPKFAPFVPSLLHLFTMLPQTTGSPLAAPLTHVIHALLNIPIQPYADLWFPEAKQHSPPMLPAGVEALQKVRRSLSRSSSSPQSRTSTPPNGIGPATDPLRRAYDLLDATLAYFAPGDPDDPEVRAKCKKQDIALEDVVPPLPLLLGNMVRGNDGARSRMKQWLLPADLDRSQPLEKRADMLGRCLRIMQCVYFPKLKDSIGEMLFALCGSDANVMGAQLGYGNCAGFLFNKGIMAPPPSTNGKEDEIPDDPDINPITGSKFKPSGPDALAGMTEEEKEREAEKLFVLFDRLEKMGMAVNPVRKAQQEGKLEEVK